MKKIFKTSFWTHQTIVLDLEDDTSIYFEYKPVGSNKCALLLPDGECIEFPDKNGSYHAKRRFSKGECRILPGYGGGLLTGYAVADDFEYKDVRDYGAVGDGVTDDTTSVQKAIDAGGQVFFPEGKYRTGTLYLKAGGGLTLAWNAEIIGSGDITAYNKPDFCPQNSICKSEKANGAHLIAAVEQNNIAINGYGTINGNRPAFFDWDTMGSIRKFDSTRPSQMIFIAECDNVSVDDVKLVDSPYWHCYIFGCDGVRVDGVTIESFPRETWNGDGIGLDCVKNSTVTNCTIYASDDCVTVRASQIDRLQHHTPVSENILIANNRLFNGHCGVRVGVGTGTIRDVVIRDCTAKDTYYGIGIHSAYLPQGDTTRGVNVENILVENIDIDCGAPFYVSSNGNMGAFPHSKSHVRDITFRHIRARGFWNALLEGNDDYNVTNLTFEDVAVEMYGGDAIEPDIPQEKRVDRFAHRYPYGIVIRNIKDAVFRNFSVNFHPFASKLWQKEIWIERCVNIAFVEK